MPDANCLQCAAVFKVKASRVDIAKFCSRDCLKAHSSFDQECKCCGVIFKVHNSKAGKKFFCSQECKVQNSRKVVTCEVCSSQFTTALYRGLKYCSRDCFHVANKGSKHRPDPNHVKHFIECLICKKEFRVTATRKDTAKYCSHACMSQCLDLRYRKSIIKRGDKSVRWTGGKYLMHNGYVRQKTKILKHEKSRLEHRNVMFHALLKDNPFHRFLVVDSFGEIALDSNIEVHHIDRIRSNNDISNLLAVTKLAHARIHHHNKKPESWECWPSDPPAW